MKCPCRGCEDRKLGCHGFCKRYQAFRDEREEISRKRYEEQKARDTMSERGKRLIIKYRRMERQK